MEPLSIVSLLTLACFGSVAATAAAPTAADRAFVAKVSQGGMFEVKAGKLATQKASTVDLRDFATAEVHDHSLVGDKLKAISSGEGIAIAPALNADFSGRLNHLSGLDGVDFDAAYLSEMASLHDADGAAFAQEASTGGSKAFRNFGDETHRIVQRHIPAIRALPAK